MRKIIYIESEKEKQDKLWWWIYELDESYFWPKRIRWKRWRWAGCKTIVFWILKRWWSVYTEIISDAKAKSLIPIIRWKITDWSTVNTDWWKAYDWLVDLWYEKHYRVHHWKNEFARWKQHINENHFGVLQREDYQNLIESKKNSFIYIWKNLNSDIM